MCLMNRGKCLRNVMGTMNHEERFIRERECEKLSGLSRTTRWRLEQKGEFPKRRQLSKNSIGWLYSEIMAWIREKARAA